MPVLTVIAAVVERDGRFLVTRRPSGVHLEGYWEFPGGKCEPGEAHAACLARELDEELGVGCRAGRLILSVTHPYDDRTIELYFYACEIDGIPNPLLGQELKWAGREELSTLTFPPADEQLIKLLSSGMRRRGAGSRTP